MTLTGLDNRMRNCSDVLAEIKGDPDVKTIPVVVLTISEAADDVARSYRLHANAYITKPADFERFRQIVHQIDEFIVGVVQLPPCEAA